MSDEQSQDSLGDWYRVPDGSTLHFGVRRTSDRVQAAAVLLVNDQQREIDPIPDQEQVELLESPNRYTVRIYIKFRGETENEAEVYAYVKHEDGSVHDKRTYRYGVKGSKESIARATLVVYTSKTKKSKE